MVEGRGAEGCVIIVLVAQGLLVSRSTTTGWTDWIHGDLWVLPTRGLLRRRLGLVTTLRHVFGADNGHSAGDELDFTDSELQRIASEHRTNSFIPKESIGSADLRPGIMTGRLSLTLKDETRVKFLWLKSDHADHRLAPVLRDWLEESQ